MPFKIVRGDITHVKADVIVQKAIIEKQYDIYQLNLVLFQYTNEILGVQPESVAHSATKKINCKYIM